MPLFKCEELKTIYTQYRGEYEVTPTFEEQELKTKNKMLNKNVKVNKIYVGKTINEGGQMVTGTMVNNGAQESTITTKDQEVNIKNGFHDGSGKVSIAPEEQAKIIGDNILEGVTILGVKGTRKPASGVKIESAKSVVPSFTAQTITPSTGYDAMSQVNVSAIAVTKTLNSAGGYTVTIG